MFSSITFRALFALLVVLALFLGTTQPATAAPAQQTGPGLIALSMNEIVTNRARMVQASFIFVALGVLLLCYKHK